MKIIMAEHAGFCFGVKRAVDAIEKALENSGEVWTIGLPIHNPQEVSRLEAMGLRVANNESEIPAGADVLIRAHGEPLNVIESLLARDIDVRDMTCPFVKKAQDMAAELSGKDYHVVLLGDKNHPEIKGILGHVISGKTAEVVANEDEAENITRHSKIALISQTTQREERLSKVAGILTRKCFELHVCNTICKATAERQDAVKELVNNHSVDGVVLIGGRASANTGKLRDIIKSQNIDVLWVEDENEIESNLDWFRNKSVVGIAAGASTPAWLIDKIRSSIAQFNFSGGIHQ
ncbi:MAG: 4-hydroxy-3-methylbut-2-enyl diphosphate reductase [Synergistaceae bacterium]|nr:4-hydroxy-3-methylbut-2-enyl diphosphate reductase [Synergistaceae bacterium]